MVSTGKNKAGRVISINVSKTKGISKTPVRMAKLIEQFGVEGDVHAGLDDLRQVSLLAFESIKKVKSCPKVKQSGFDLKHGDFA